jgi:hypothetical protein
VTPLTPSGNRFFFLLIDDLSRYKDRAMAAFMMFKAQTEAKCGRKLETLCIDHGGEFTACMFIDHYMEEGIKHHLMASYSPEQNGVIERHNQTIMGMAQSMLKVMEITGWFWGGGSCDCGLHF